MEKPECELSGEDGNIFSIISRCSRSFRRAGQSDQAQKMQEEIMAAKSYDEALQIIMKYVEVR